MLTIISWLCTHIMNTLHYNIVHTDNISIYEQWANMVLY